MSFAGGSIHDFLNGAVYTEVLRCALQIKLFDHLGDDRLTEPELLHRMKTDSTTVTPMLHLLAEMGVLVRHRDRFWNSDDAKKYLVSRQPEFLGDHLKHLLDSVIPRVRMKADEILHPKDPTPTPELRLHCDRRDKFYLSDEQMESFSKFASPTALRDGEFLAKSFDLSRFETLADLGGNDGSLLGGCLRRLSKATGVVFDLPEVAPLAQRRIRELELEGRMTFQSLDFFKDPLPKRDFYHCGYVLHDWSDHTAKWILSRLTDAINPGGVLVLSGHFLDDPAVGKRLSLARDNFVLVAYANEVKRVTGEKTTQVYAAWLAEDGFEVEDVIFGPGRSFLIARKTNCETLETSIKG